MNKIELNRLSQVNNNEQNFLAALNENLKRIQEAINDTLSRTGVKPNQMEEVLDMNGNRICNVGPAVELTDVVTKQDIQNIIDAANEAIARLDGLVEAGKTALMNYAQEYIYPTVTAALDGAQAAQRAAEAARDALLLNPDYQALTQNLPTIMTLVDNITVLENIRDNMTELLAVSDDLTNIDAVAADLTNLDAIAGNLEEILRSSTYAQQAAQSASQASTSASNAANSATAAAGSATTATNKANEASASATAASGSASNAADSATAAASSATTAANKANTARIWAEGTDGEVVPLGGSHSAKVWAQYVEEIIAGTRIFGGSFDASTATATLTSAAKAKLGTDDNTIVLTNDTTPITGYAANEAIEYVVTVDGTFAGLTLKVNDILWSSGLSWYKIDNSETVIADATESTKGIAALATTAEAEAGANDTKIMTPLKTKQAILELAPAPADASTSTKGVLQLANNAEAAAGSNETKAMTPETTKKAIATQTYNNLSASQRATLLSNGTYMGDTVDTGRIFELDSGKFESFTDTVTGATLSNTVSSVDLQVSGWTSGASNRGGYIFNREHDIILKYTNGSWQEVSHAFTLDYLVAPQDTVDIFAVDTSGVLYHSTEDSPSTWETFTTLSNYEIDDTAFYAEKVETDGFYYITWYGSGGYVYLARYPISGGTLTQIYSSTDWGTGARYPFFVYSEGKIALYPGGRVLPGGLLFTSPKNSSSRSTLVWQGDNYYKNFRSVTKVGTIYYFCDVYNSQILSTSTPTVSGSYTVVNIASLSGSFYHPFLLANYQNTLLAVPCYSTGDLYYSTNATSPSFTKYADISGMTKHDALLCTFAGDHLFVGSYSDSTIYGIAVTANHNYSLTPLSYTAEEVDTALADKQDTLTAGANITIDSNNVISATGGGGSASYDPTTQEITLG